MSQAESSSTPPAVASSPAAVPAADTAVSLADPKVSPILVAILSLGAVVAVVVVVLVMLGTKPAANPEKIRDAFFAELAKNTDFKREAIDTVTFAVGEDAFRIKAIAAAAETKDGAVAGVLAISVERNDEPLREAKVKATPTPDGTWAIQRRDNVTGPDGWWHVSGELRPWVELKTNYGAIVIECFEDELPNAVANFVELAESGFYRGVRFHRIIRDFMIQTGDPNTKNGLGPDAGSGGPGYRIADEPAERKFNRIGLVAYANSGPSTTGSQFFITTSTPQHLNGKHMILGHVIKGMDVVRQIAAAPVGPGGGMGETSTPLVDVIIEDTRVLQKRDHPYTAAKLND